MEKINRTKIVSTLGPASSKPKIISELIQAGVDVFRLNFSHGKREDKIKLIKKIRKESEKLNTVIAVMADLGGPKIRLGKLAEEFIFLEKGLKLTLFHGKESREKLSLPVNFPDLNAIIKNKDKIMLRDGSIVLEALSVEKDKVLAKVINEGEITSQAGVNLPTKEINLPAITNKDKKDLEAACKAGIDFVALSFVNQANDVLSLRKLIKDSGFNIPIISKIERAVALDNIDSIIDVSDGIMIARGDLGIEIPPEEVPIIQKELIVKVSRFGKPVIIATQMLESMVNNIYPTRAEASDIANAIFDGADAVMLSAETAIGKYPVKTVETMSKIAKRADESLPYRNLLKQRLKWAVSTTTEAISFSTCEMAQKLKADAIITSTQSGTTAKQVSKYRPKTPILAVCPSFKTVRQLKLTWGVTPLLVSESKNIDDMLDICVQTSLEHNLVKSGDLIIITAGVMVNVPGTTNLIKVHRIP